MQESSNGCASGGALAEAVYFGLMEVVERDAFLIAWYAKAELPEIDPYTSGVPATVHMVERLAMYGYRARFFDTRITFPIPVVTAVAERIDGGTRRAVLRGRRELGPGGGARCRAVRDRHRRGQPAHAARCATRPGCARWPRTSTRCRCCTTTR